MKEVKKICFVCLGNIVRSPLAENVFRKLADEAGVSHKYKVDSAGTSGWHVGEQPDLRMRRVAADHGLKYAGQARQFEVDDFGEFDLIVAMDVENRDHLLGISPHPKDRAKVRLLREFDPMGGTHHSVPDPYYGGMDGFEEVYQIVEISCQGLLKALEAQEG